MSDIDAGYKQIKLQLRGLAPMLINCDRGANPLEPMNIPIKQITLKGKAKTEEDLLLLEKLQWKRCFYGNPAKQGVVIPSRTPWAACRDGAKKVRGAPKFVQGTVLPFQSHVALTKFDGKAEFPPSETMLDDMWEAKNAEGLPRFAETHFVVTKGSKVPRIRVSIQNWELETNFSFDPTMVDAAAIVNAMKAAGKYLGLGDFRPAKSGNYGRFEVVNHWITED